VVVVVVAVLLLQVRRGPTVRPSSSGWDLIYLKAQSTANQFAALHREYR
jgi:hypothetical protein